jgi:hypothetical protein
MRTSQNPQNANFAIKEFYEVPSQACSTASSRTISPGSAVAPVPTEVHAYSTSGTVSNPLWNIWGLFGVDKH